MNFLQKLLDEETISQAAFDALQPEFNTLNSQVSDARDESAGRRIKLRDLEDQFKVLKTGKPDDALTEQIRALTEQVTTLTDENKEEKAKGLKLEANSALNKELSKFNLLDRELVAGALSGNLVRDDGVLKFNDNGIHKTLEEGVKAVIGSRYQGQLKAAGNGSGSGAGGAGSSGVKEMSRSDFDKLPAGKRVEIAKTTKVVD